MMAPVMAHGGHHHHQVPAVPPIVEMLMREADAWRAVTALHAMSMGGARQVVAGATLSQEASIHSDDATDATEQREAQYYQSITGLAAQCDALVNELVKLRSLRKARKTVEIAIHRELMRVHSDEVVALGAKLASEGALSVTAATADLRLASQKIRNQLAQCRALLQAVQESESSTVPTNARIVVGLERSGSTVVLHSVSDLLRNVYAHSAALSEEKLVAALLQPVQEASSSQNTAPTPSASARHFSRRAAASDRSAALCSREGRDDRDDDRSESPKSSKSSASDT